MGIQQPRQFTPEELDALTEEPFAPDDPDGLKFLAEQEKAAREAAEKAEQEKYNDEARRRLNAQDTVRREREQAELDGALSGDAELFYETTLRPRLAEAHDFQPQQRIPIVQGLFNRNTLSWTAGPSGTFKSFVTADLAFRYGSEDMDYHGRKMTHGRALIIVAEGEGGYADRKTAWEKQYGREVKNVVLYPGALQLADINRDMPALLKVLKEEDEAGNPFTLIIVDTQAMCTVGVDENKSEMNLVINVLHRIRKVSGACVIPVHHFGKNEKSGMRGSSMLYAAADTVLILKRKDDAMTVTLSTAQSDEGKQKDTGGEKDFLTLELKVHTVSEDYFGDPVTSLVAIPAEEGGHDVTDSGATGPVSIPEVTDVQLFYLQALSSYEEDGAAVTRFEKDVSVGMALDELSPPAGHTPYRQAYDKNLRALRKKGMVEKHPKYDSRWRVTAIGAGAIMRELKDRDDRRDKIAQWAESPSRRKGSGTVHEPLIDLDSEPE